MNATFVRDWPTGVRLAAGTLAVVLFADVVIAASVPGAQAADVTTAARVAMPPRIVIRAPSDVSALYQALRRSPFDLSDSVPATDATLAVTTPAPQGAAPDEPKLIGTVSQGTNSGFVMLELADKRVQLVHIGERAGDLTLRTVSLGEASFDDASTGKRITLKTVRTTPDTNP